MYLNGSWPPKDYVKGAKHLHKAAEPKEGSGDCELGSMMLAQLELSTMYLNGYGVEKSEASR